MAPGNARRSGPTVELLTPSRPAWDDHLAVARRDIYHLAGYHAYAEGSGKWRTDYRFDCAIVPIDEPGSTAIG